MLARATTVQTDVSEPLPPPVGGSALAATVEVGVAAGGVLVEVAAGGLVAVSVGVGGAAVKSQFRI